MCAFCCESEYATSQDLVFGLTERRTLEDLVSFLWYLPRRSCEEVLFCRFEYLGVSIGIGAIVLYGVEMPLLIRKTFGLLDLEEYAF